MSEFKIEPGIPISRIEVDFEDLIGQRFGRLVVIERAENHGNRICWLCRCDCGREKIVRMTSLRIGDTSSCGCLSVELTAERRRASVPNLVGQRFGRLIVLSQNGQWCQVRCDCDRGMEKTLPAHELLSGKVDSCGCLTFERYAERQRAKVMQHRNQGGK